MVCGVWGCVCCGLVACGRCKSGADAMRGRERELGGPHVGGAGTYLYVKASMFAITIYGKRVDGM
jgi:hypothetical protein